MSCLSSHAASSAEMLLGPLSESAALVEVELDDNEYPCPARNFARSRFAI